jgi:GT2 family glycosyltransferase
LDLSIIIVNYNGFNYIKKCLESISTNFEPFLWEVIVVDNGSIDESINYLRKIKSKNSNFYLIENINNYGFAKASNIGAVKANGEFLLFLNPDTEIIQGGIKDIVNFCRGQSTREKIGVVGAKVINPDGTLQYSCRSFPTIARQFYESFFLYRIFKNSKVFGSYFLSYWDHNRTIEVDWLTGAFMLLKKDTFFSVGGFDEDYFLYSEDTDLCLKFNRSGFKNYYFNSYQLKHSDGGVASSDISLRNVQIWKSRRLYFLKNYSKAHALFLSYFYFLGVVNRIVLFVFLVILNPKKKEIRNRLKSYLKTLKLYFSNSLCK